MMTRFLPFIWLLLGSILGYSQVSAQSADSVGSIPVSPRSTSGQKARHYAHGYTHEHLFFQRHELRLINFNRRENAPLNQAYCKIDSLQAPHRGLVQHLIHGLFLGEIRAIDPSRHQRDYRYFDLLSDMAHLQGLSLKSLPSLPREALAWDNLEHVMLVARNRGFDHQRAIEFDQPTWLHLIWYDPQSKQRVPLAVFDLREIHPWLEQLYCPWRNAQGRATGTDAMRWLRARTPRYPQVELQAGQLTILPPDRRSLDQWPDFYPAKH